MHFNISLFNVGTKFQVEMLHRAVRNFSQDLQVKFRWMWIYCNPIYWGFRWMLAHCNSDLTVQFVTWQYITLWIGDIRNNKGEDCASNQDCAPKESVWGGWHPSAEFSSHQQNNARYAYCCNTSKTRKTNILFLKVNLAQALQRSLLTPSMLVKVRWYQLPGSLQVLILLLFKVDVESLADFGNGGQVR